MIKTLKEEVSGFIILGLLEVDIDNISFEFEQKKRWRRSLFTIDRDNIVYYFYIDIFKKSEPYVRLEIHLFEREKEIILMLGSSLHKSKKLKENLFENFQTIEIFKEKFLERITKVLDVVYNPPVV